MAVSQIKLTESALKQKKEKLEELNQKLKKQVKELNTLEKSLKSMWTGDAADAFDATYTKDEEAYEKFIDLVVKYIGALESIMKAYEQGEKTNVGTAKKRSFK